MEAIDATAKLSDRLGIATEDLAAYQHAASLSDTSSEALNAGLDRLSRTIGGLKAGNKSAIDAFEALGISAEQARSMAPADAFEEIADRISKITDPTKRAAAAFGIFGKQSAELMNTLLIGRSGLEDMRREADELGLTFSRLDASKVEEANDAITRLKAAFTGLGNELAIGVAPGLTDFVDTMRQLAHDAREFGPAIAEIFASLTGNYEEFAQAQADAATAQPLQPIKEMVPEVEELAEGVNRLKSLVASTVSPFDKLAASIKQVNEAIASGAIGEGEGLVAIAAMREQAAGTTDAIRDLEDQLAVLTGQATEAEVAVQRMIETGGANADQLNKFLELSRQIEAVKAATEQAEKAQEAFNDRVREAESLTASVRTPFEVFRDEVDKARDLFQEGLISQDTFERAVAAARGDFIDSEKKPNSNDRGPQFAGAALRNSSEAFGAVARAGLGNKDDKAIAHAKKTAEMTAKANGYLQGIAKDSAKTANAIGNLSEVDTFL